VRQPLFAFSLVFLHATLVAVAAPGVSPVVEKSGSAQVADYYYSRHAYAQALPLWLEIARRQPSSVLASLRVTELKLIVEGREAARSWLKEFISREAKSMSVDSRRLVEQRLAEIQDRFLTDDGQSFYHQAKLRIRRKDCEGALPLLAQSQAVENGNLALVREKARCERTLRKFEPYFESLVSLYEANPLSRETQEDLAEASLYFRQPDRAIRVFETRLGGTPSSPYARLLYGIALLEKGKTSSAQLLLEPLVAKSKRHSLSPVVYFGVGKIHALKGGKASAVEYLEKFLTSATPSENEWDPFHLEERQGEARRLLATLQQP